MNLMKRFNLFFIMIFLGSAGALSAQSSAGRGLSYVRSAWNIDKGYFIVYSHARFFGKVGNINLERNVTSAVTFWDIQQGLSFNYGINKNFELAIMPILYQDNQKGGKGYNLIDDIMLTLKMGSFGKTGSSLKFGIDAATRIPTADKHNVAFEPYSADKLNFGFTGRASFSGDPLYPDDGFGLHVNLGYWNHNDVGEQLTETDALIDTVRVDSPSQELNFGVGVMFPTDRFDFSLEFHGNTFLQAPPITAYSRESFAYVTPKVRYKAYRWLSLDMGVDVRVSKDRDVTNYDFISNYPNLPNYPAWRINIGARLTVLPTTVYSVSERDLLMKKAETRRELFEQIIREQRETESAEDELERIKDERRKAERELERLRRILEGDEKQKKVKEKKKKGNNNG